MTITLRGTKGAPLTYEEADNNFSELDRRTKLAWVQSGSEVQIIPDDPNSPQFQSFKGGLYAWSYPSGAYTEAHLSFDVDYSYAPGTDLYIGIHWSPGIAGTTGNVRFGVEFTWAWSFGNTQESPFTTFSPPSTVYINAAADGTPYKNYLNFNNYADRFPGAYVQGNMRFLARIFRDGEHPTDTFPDSIFIFGVDLFYQVDKIGTTTREPPFTY